jgi:carboxyl-terminal processing protease
MVELLGHEHLLRKPIDDDLSRTAFATYLDRLDSSKMYLLKRDRDALAKYADKIDDELRTGSLELAHQGEKIIVARFAVVEKEVAELLAAPFNFDKEEWYETDAKKVELATTEDELRDRWRRRLELQVLERVATMEARLKSADEAKAKAVAKPAKAKKRPAKAAKPSIPPVKVGGPKDVPSEAAPDDADDDDDADSRATPIAAIPPTPEAREAKARAELAKSYAALFVRRSHPGTFGAASELLNAVTSSLDPHTNYLPPAERANFDIRMSGSLEGIGAVLREHDDLVEIASIVPGGASWRDGRLGPGDLILSVAADGKDPVDVTDMALDDVVGMIRGPKGSIVHLRVQKPTGVQSTVDITRDVVVVEESYARGALIQHKGQPAFGYIYLPSFYGGKGAGQRTAAGDVSHLLGEMKAKKIGGVVIDIRGNGGGFLGDAIEMTGSLIDHGPVVQVQDNRGRREILSDDHAGTDYDGQVIVLVDRFSASASEIVAAALQDYHRAVIVGTGPTHGKGTVQTLAELDRVTGSKIDLGSLKITIQQFFRVNGVSTQREGVTPDVLLPDPAAHIETGERTLEHAIPASQISAAEHEDWKATWKPAVLVEHSASRVAKQPVFAKMAALTQVLKASRDDTRIPLQRAAFDAHRAQQRAAFEAASPDLKNAPAQLIVKSLDAGVPLPPPPPGGRVDDRMKIWRDSVSRDPWIDECVNILGDMAK